MTKALLPIGVAASLLIVGGFAIGQLWGNDARRQAAVAVTTDPVQLTWRGAWSASTKFTPGQVVSQSGSSYVAEQNSVGSSPLCAGTTPDCPWALLASRGPQGLPGARGAQGDHGLTGAQGEPGSDGALTGVQIVSRNETIQAGDSDRISVSCPSGKAITGGGFSISGQLELRESEPVGSIGLPPYTWAVEARNSENFDAELRVFAMCANAS